MEANAAVAFETLFVQLRRNEQGELVPWTNDEEKIPLYIFVSISTSINLRRESHAWHTARVHETQDMANLTFILG